MSRVSFSPRPWVAGLLVTGAAGSWLLALRTPMPGRFLFLVAGAGLTFEAVRATVLRPTVRADRDGVEVLTGLRRERLRWADVENVTTLGPPAHGGGLRRNANALEIDLGDRLVVVPAYRLGTSGETAAAELAELRSTSS